MKCAVLAILMCVCVLSVEVVDRLSQRRLYQASGNAEQALTNRKSAESMVLYVLMAAGWCERTQMREQVHDEDRRMEWMPAAAFFTGCSISFPRYSKENITCPTHPFPGNGCPCPFAFSLVVSPASRLFDASVCSALPFCFTEIWRRISRKFAATVCIINCCDIFISHA